MVKAAGSRSGSAYHTDYWTTVDALHFDDFCPALREILLGADTPLTVGVFGPWGSGKTSLLRMLEREIQSSGNPFIRPVWFTAWKYDRHDALWRAFILRVLDGLYPRKPGDGPWEERDRIPHDDLGPEQKETVELLDRLARSLYGTVEWEEIGRWVFEWNKAGLELAKLPAFLTLLPIFPLGGDKVAELTGIAPKLGELMKRETQVHQLDRVSSMEQFEATFQKALEAALGQNGRLVVFVDDLDRCLPEKSVEVLEAIKLFLEVSGTVFVLGMDPEVVRRGIDVRYKDLFREQIGEGRDELPVRGDTYLQKIVQVQFYLPPMAVDDVRRYIDQLEEQVQKKISDGLVDDPDILLSETTKEVFARGLLPNPRQVKRALNIFRLLRRVALVKEGRPEDQGGLPPESVAWPLLAKTVCIQIQWPELYNKWRSVPTLVQTLENEYERRPTKDDEAERGWPLVEEKEQARTGDLLADFLTDRRKYIRLERMLRFPTLENKGEDRDLARFADLGRGQMDIYVRLAGALESAGAAVEVSSDLLAEMLSGDRARLTDAVARLKESESDPAGQHHETLRDTLQRAMRDEQRPVRERVSAGDALSLLGDPRFRADAWFLPNDETLGFIEVPEGPFLMGSDPEKDVAADKDEQPQREVYLSGYRIARYPVTVAQFRAFVENSGYDPADRDSLRGFDSHPVVWMTWRDAQAYCGWLSEALRQWREIPEPLATSLHDKDWAVRLPTEAEWEKAARGTNGRIYPWGDNADPNRANYDVTGIGTTSAVGCFPGGASPYKCEDMSGNVWEWTHSLFKGYPYDARDGRENEKAGDDVRRVRRGGSFYDYDRSVRCAFRNNLSPNYHNGNSGFRVVLAPYL